MYIHVKKVLKLNFKWSNYGKKIRPNYFQRIYNACLIPSKFLYNQIQKFGWWISVSDMSSPSMVSIHTRKPHVIQIINKPLGATLEWLLTLILSNQVLAYVLYAPMLWLVVIKAAMGSLWGALQTDWPTGDWVNYFGLCFGRLFIWWSEGCEFKPVQGMAIHCACACAK